MTTFTKFVYQYLDEDTPRGDLARDWKGDTYKPKKIKSWSDVSFYLRKACQSAREEAALLWEDYTGENPIIE